MLPSGAPGEIFFKKKKSWWCASPAEVSLLPVQFYGPPVVLLLFERATVLCGTSKITL